MMYRFMKMIKFLTVFMCNVSSLLIFLSSVKKQKKKENTREKVLDRLGTKGFWCLLIAASISWSVRNILLRCLLVTI